MLEALLLSMSCTLVTNVVEYRNSAYHSLKIINCPASAVGVKLPYKSIFKSDEVRVASLTVGVDASERAVVVNELEVERPWIAPIPIFMEVAKNKHDDKLAEELKKLLK